MMRLLLLLHESGWVCVGFVLINFPVSDAVNVGQLRHVGLLDVLMSILWTFSITLQWRLRF